MSLKSVKDFLLDFKASDEVGSIVGSLNFKESDMNKKIDLIVIEASKRGYDFTSSELKEVVDEYINVHEDDNFENVTGGKASVNAVIKSLLPYYK